MESMNKFKVLTIMIICLFVFAIAAMYVNTKEASEQKNNDVQEEQRDYDISETRARKEKMDMVDIMYALDDLENKVNELSSRVDKNASRSKFIKQQQGYEM